MASSMNPSRREFVASVAGGARMLATRDLRFATHKEASPLDVKPTPQQLAWQESELSMFLHFGVNTFTDREWGEGTEAPHIFNPTALDAGQWAQVARETGFHYVILTAKHHDGFCLWPSRFTDHCVRSSPWRGGKGDVVAEFAHACRRERLKVGLYVSPWDRHEPTYGDSPAYNRHFMQQLEDLMTQYGEIAEVWFDGACGSGPNGKRQEYDWQGYYGVIRKHQPKALIAICGPDIRWVGNEDGFAHETEWCVQDASPAIHGHGGKVWWPAECDVSIRPRWFWHRSQDTQVKLLDQLMDIYYKSVGRNSNLLLNVPPNDRGLLSEPDVARLCEFRVALDRTFATNLAAGRAASDDGHAPERPAACVTDGRSGTFWCPPGDPTRGSVEVDLGRPAPIGIVVLQERIAQGQRIEEYRVEARSCGVWCEASKGTTIGHKKIDRFSTLSADRLRVTVLRSRECPMLRAVGVYAAA